MSQPANGSGEGQPLMTTDGGADNNLRTERLNEIYNAIYEGAESFLRAEYTVCFWFIIVFASIILVLVSWGTGWDAARGGFTAISFLLGAITSMLSGYLGMKVAVYSNVRTTISAQKPGWTECFNTAFRAGAVMGFALCAMGILMLYGTMLVFRLHYPHPKEWIYLTESITGFGLGGSVIAMFGRVGGGIYTKAADVGADLVGKVVHGIPEDDPRNRTYILFLSLLPALCTNALLTLYFFRHLISLFFKQPPQCKCYLTNCYSEPLHYCRSPFSYRFNASRYFLRSRSADNVGDNVGDVAGMGSDLFGSFAESTCAALVIGSSIGVSGGWDAMVFPVCVSAVGIFVCLLCSFIATHIYPVKNESHVEQALKLQLISTTVLMIPAIYYSSVYFLPSSFDLAKTVGLGSIAITPFMATSCVAMGAVGGLTIGLVTEYYTSHSYSPVREVANACKTGAATNIIYGIALGYKSAIIPVLVLALVVYGSFTVCDMYGVALAAIGFLSNLATGLTIDVYGPVCDNAGMFILCRLCF